MNRWLVEFRSHVDAPSDNTFVDVRGATCMLGAIALAKREQPPQHPWSIVYAWPWPRGCPGVEEAAELLTKTATKRR